MARLNRDYYLKDLGGKGELLEMPVRVLQFGAGVFLRGFLEDFIHLANAARHFSGSVAAVQRRSSRAAAQLKEQDCLYTLYLRGVEKGTMRREHRVMTSLGKLLFADQDWQEVLELAARPEIQWVFSNTTEAGFELDPRDHPAASPPVSYPAKLTACLWHRFESAAVDGSMWILPCELIDDNGARLRELVVRLAESWSFPRDFFTWLDRNIRFCNTLVDRIVTGVPEEKELRTLWDAIGYEDRQLITGEPFYLFAVEAPEELQESFPIHREASNVRFVPDISLFRLKKMRVLNGAHTAMTPVSYLAGNETVGETLEHGLTGPFVRKLILDEIVPALGIPEEEGRAYAEEVLDRFRNPFIVHPLINISLNCTYKFRVRLIPTLENYQREKQRLPEALLFALAAHLLFLREKRNGQTFSVEDQRASKFAELWAAVEKGGTLDGFLKTALSDVELWGSDLTTFPGLQEKVAEQLKAMRREGVLPALERFLQTCG